MESKYLSYEQFGAVGDGVHDDIEAIVACHDEANRLNVPVKAKDGATYYIGGKKMTAVIKTDVDFGKAKFIIDDIVLEDRESYVFSIESDYSFEPVEIESLAVDQRKLNLDKKGNYFVRVFDDNHRVFRRKGVHANNGSAAEDIFIVDSEGNILTTIDFDYPKVTRSEMKCIDDAPITVSGGIFTTIANQMESYYYYHFRGFNVTRAHVTICGFEHYVEGELDHGAPYHGFIRSNYAADLTIKDAIVTGRRMYQNCRRTTRDGLGSYDLSFWSSIDVRCINVKQSNDITDHKYWGVYTSNFCKNLMLDSCVLSRFDAHMGVTNFTIRNSKLGHSGIMLTGFGEGIIENTEVYTHSFIILRPDYGSTWNGTLSIKDCVWCPDRRDNSMVYAVNTEDHDFGYYCCQPKVMTIDGMHVKNADVADMKLYLLRKFTDRPISEEKASPYGRVNEFYISRLTTDNGAELELSECPELYPETKVIYKD
ncbi:MAG: hypothetical protein IKB51_05240 [Clostridia bacterium]|nr:hypothetical protein [Clostridia bacterium]